MKKRIISLLIAIGAVLLISVPVLAAGYVYPVTVTNANASAFTNTPFKVSIDNTALVSGGYIASDGLDTAIIDGSTSLPHLVTDDAVWFVGDVPASGSKTFNYTSGNTPAASMPIIVGNGGYVTTADNADLEPGNMFQIDISGYIDTASGSDKYIVNKAGAITIQVTDDQELTATVNDGTDTHIYFNNVVSGYYDVSLQLLSGSLTFTVGTNTGTETGVGTISDTAADWLWNQNDIMPYIDYIKISVASTVTASFYPDANPETTSVDGFVTRGTSHESWANKIAGSGTLVNDSQNAHEIIIMSDWNSGEWKKLSRVILLFDTSSLGAGFTFTGATLDFVGTAKVDNLGITPDINLYGSTPASNTGLVEADYSQVGSTPYCDTPITYAGFVNGGWNTFTLNADGLAAINTTGISKFSIRNANYDVSGTEPTWSTVAYSQLGLYSGDETNTLSYRPRLTISYLGLTEVLLYQPENIISGTTLPDLDGTEDGVITWGANPANITATPGTMIPSNPARLVASSGSTVGELLTSDGDAPVSMYTDSDPSGIPGGAVIQEFLLAGEVPVALWWFPFIFCFIAIVGMLAYDATTAKGTAEGSILVQFIVCELLLIVFGVLHYLTGSTIIPLFPAFLFPLVPLAIILQPKRGNLQ